MLLPIQVPAWSDIAGSCLRRLVRGFVRFYYPRVEVEGREQIPSGRPLLFVANHPNSLIDPVMIGIAARQPVSFLAKAPLFDIPVFGALLRAVGMLPAFRGTDDVSQVRRNLESLAAAARGIASGHAAALFPEGLSHDSLKLAMIRSGAARIALQAVALGARELQIVPVGINYQKKERFGSAVWIRIGEPISAAAVLDQFAGEERRALRALTEEIEARLKTVVIHLTEEKWEPYLEYLESIFPPAELRGNATLARFRQRKRIADAMNYFSTIDSQRVDRAATAMAQHCHRLAVAGLQMDSPLLNLRSWRLAAKWLLDSVKLMFGLVPVLAGTLHHIVPWSMLRLGARRLQAPGQSTVSLTRLALGFPLFAVWYVGVWFWMSDFFRPWVATTWTILMPLAGTLAVGYWRRAHAAARLWWDQVRLLTHRSALERFRQHQAALRRDLEQFAAEYRAAPPGSAQEKASGRRDVKSGAGASASAAVAKYALVVAAAIVLAAAVFWKKKEGRPAAPAASTRAQPIAEQEVRARLERDERALTGIIAGLEQLKQRALEVRSEFVSGQRSYYRQADNDVIRQLLLSYLNYRAALLRIMWHCEGAREVGDEPLRARVFLAGFTAASQLYEASLRFVVEFGQSADAIRKLNEAEPQWGVPAGIYDRVRDNLTNADTQRLMREALAEYHALTPQFAKHELEAGSPFAVFHRTIRQSAEAASELGPMLPRDVLPPSVEVLGRRAMDLAYRGKSLVSIWVGDARIRAPRGGKPLIERASLAALREQLRPGDILLERRNWYLSNAFLPGFWPHAALYVGTPEDLTRLGWHADPRVQKHWKAFVQPDEQGHPHVIIESVSEGVVFTSLEHSMGGADSAAVLRPNLDPALIRESIAEAFGHYGKPYDFDFDFFSTDKLVCTELVFRAYDGRIDFPLVDILGRRTMPAIELVRKFATECDRPGACFAFVAFLDGDEEKGRAEFKDQSAFVATLNRPALTWLQ